MIMSNPSQETGPGQHPLAESGARKRAEQVSDWISDRGTKHDFVAAAITREILQRGLKIGDALPSERKLAAQLHVSYMTARAGVTRLVESGFVERRQGQGAFLLKELRPTTIAAVHLDRYSPQTTMLYHLLPAFQSVVEAAGMTLETVETASDERAAADHADLLRRWQHGELRGVLIVSRYPARQILHLIASGIPFVWVGSTLAKEPVYSVLIDAFAALYGSISFFKKNRSRHLHIFFPVMDRDWEQCFRHLDLCGAWPMKKITLHSYQQTGTLEAEVSALMDRLEFPCSLYLSTDSVYRVVLKEALKRGIRVPEELTLVTEYIVSPAESFEIAPCGWEFPFEEMARLGLSLLEEAAKHLPDAPIVRSAAPVFRPGASAIF